MRVGGFGIFGIVFCGLWVFCGVFFVLFGVVILFFFILLRKGVEFVFLYFIFFFKIFLEYLFEGFFEFVVGY